MQLLLLPCLMLAAGLSIPSQVRPSPVQIQDAWEAWRAADIRGADALARSILAADPDHQSALHLRVLTAHSTGDYSASIEAFERLDPGLEEYEAVGRFAVETYLHAGRHDDAVAAAIRSGQPESRVEWLRQRAARPMTAAVPGTAIIPFMSDNALAPLMPAVQIEINGSTFEGHLDTGGNYIIMGAALAESLGVELLELGSGIANSQTTSTRGGIADTLEMGPAKFTNVPVIVVDTLPESMPELVILGTNVLQPFLTTWDNEAGRLILTQRDDAQARHAHLQAHAAGTDPTPFYMAGDPTSCGLPEASATTMFCTSSTAAT